MLTKINYRNRNKIKHDRSCFTQGLYLDKDILYESCGAPRNTTSLLKKIDYKTNKVIISRRFPYFLEGLTVIGDIIYLLTWKQELLYMVDKNTFEIINICSYEGEGWGLTHDDSNLIMSNGSNILKYYEIPTINTKYLSLQKKIITPVSNLNELEYIDNYIYANIYFKDIIVKIDPNTGKNIKNINLKFLRNNENEKSETLNGIAYDNNKKQFLITGKYWNYIHLIII
jgi:glutamine cyclotransferase